MNGSIHTLMMYLCFQVTLTGDIDFVIPYPFGVVIGVDELFGSESISQISHPVSLKLFSETLLHCARLKSAERNIITTSKQV